MNSNFKFQASNSKGFTLVEILITMAILAIIATMGMFITFDFYKSYAFRSERNIIVSVLQKARNQSLNNINQTRHGVHFEMPLTYIIFECISTNSQCTDYANADHSKDLIIKASYGIALQSPSLPLDVMFDQLSGSSAPQTIIVTDNVKPYSITINSEGQIDTP